MKNTITDIKFFSEDAGDIYSNLYSCSFEDPTTRREFKSTEQFFMFLKADFFKDNMIATTILNTQDPNMAKRYGRQVKGYNDTHWNIMRYSFMVYANLLKFQNSLFLSQALVGTKGQLLVKLSPTDNIWGITDSKETCINTNSSEWNGQNLLGKALMEVRNILQDKAKT